MSKLQIAVLSFLAGMTINGAIGIRTIREFDKTISALKDENEDFFSLIQKLVRNSDLETLRKILNETEFERIVKYGMR